MYANWLLHFFCEPPPGYYLITHCWKASSYYVLCSYSQAYKIGSKRTIWYTLKSETYSLIYTLLQASLTEACRLLQMVWYSMHCAEKQRQVTTNNIKPFYYFISKLYHFMDNIMNVSKFDTFMIISFLHEKIMRETYWKLEILSFIFEHIVPG